MTIVDVQFSPAHCDWAELREACLAAEEAGFGALWVYDHLAGAALGGRTMIECFTLLGALAEATSRIELGALVTNVWNRQIGTLVSAAASVAIVSGRQFHFGLGAGASPQSRFADEQRAVGAELADALEERHARVEAVLDLMEREWSPGREAIFETFPLPSPVPTSIIGVNSRPAEPDRRAPRRRRQRPVASPAADGVPRGRQCRGGQRWAAFHPHGVDPLRRGLARSRPSATGGDAGGRASIGWCWPCSAVRSSSPSGSHERLRQSHPLAFGTSQNPVGRANARLRAAAPKEQSPRISQAHGPSGRGNAGKQLTSETGRQLAEGENLRVTAGEALRHRRQRGVGPSARFRHPGGSRDHLHSACCCTTTSSRATSGPEPTTSITCCASSALRRSTALIDETVPDSIRLRQPLALRDPLSEPEVLAELRGLAQSDPPDDEPDRDGLLRHPHAGRDPPQRAREPGVVHGLHAVPARDQPGTAGDVAQLPDDGEQPHRARHRQRFAARRGDRRGRGDDDGTPAEQGRRRAASSSTTTSIRRPWRCSPPAPSRSGSSWSSATSSASTTTRVSARC